MKEQGGRTKKSDHLPTSQLGGEMQKRRRVVGNKECKKRTMKREEVIERGAS